MRRTQGWQVVSSVIFSVVVLVAFSVFVGVCGSLWCGLDICWCSALLSIHITFLRMSMRFARLAYQYAVGAGSIGGGGQ